MKKFAVLMLLFVSIFTLSGCLAEEDKEVVYKLKFKLDGVQYEYKTDAKYGFVHTSSSYSYYFCFWDNSDGNTVIHLTNSVAANTTYTVGVEDWVDFEIENKDLSTLYKAEDNEFTITVNEWSTVEGGPISGTFSGKVLDYSDFTTIKNVTEGSFEAEYHGELEK